MSRITVRVYAADRVSVHEAYSWLQRLFGRRDSDRFARRDYRDRWHYVVDGARCSDRVEEAIDIAVRAAEWKRIWASLTPREPYTREAVS